MKPGILKVTGYSRKIDIWNPCSVWSQMKCSARFIKYWGWNSSVVGYKMAAQEKCNISYLNSRRVAKHEGTPQNNEIRHFQYRQLVGVGWKSWTPPVEFIGCLQIMLRCKQNQDRNPLIKLWLILIRLTLSGTLNDILFVAFRFYMDILFALNTSICILELLLWPIMMFLMSSSLNKESQSFLSFCKMLENIFMLFFKMKFPLICKWHTQW